MTGKRIFIEQWSCKPAWLALSAQERSAYAEAVGGAVAAMAAMGIRTLGWGLADPGIEEPSAYAYWAVWEIDTPEAVAAFMQGVRQSGWYEYFDQQNICGELKSPQEVISVLVGLGPA